MSDTITPCGIDCRAEAPLLDTIDGREHESCPDHACGLDCELCPGTGLPADPCAACGGDGEQLEEHDFTSRMITCSFCRGTGKAAP